MKNGKKEMEAMEFLVSDAHHRTGFFFLQTMTLATLYTEMQSKAT